MSQDLDMDKIMHFAKMHYPNTPDKQAAFFKFVVRSLQHSKEDDEYLKHDSETMHKEISKLKQRLDSLEAQFKK